MTDRKVGQKARDAPLRGVSADGIPLPRPQGDHRLGNDLLSRRPTREAGRRDHAGEADAMFEQLLERDFAAPVSAAIGDAATTSGQLGAMVALAFNNGVGPRL